MHGVRRAKLKSTENAALELPQVRTPALSALIISSPLSVDAPSPPLHEPAYEPGSRPWTRSAGALSKSPCVSEQAESASFSTLHHTAGAPSLLGTAPLLRTNSARVAAFDELRGQARAELASLAASFARADAAGASPAHGRATAHALPPQASVAMQPSPLPRKGLLELSAQAKVLGLKHGAASYALLATPLGTSPALRLSAAVEARLAQLRAARRDDGAAADAAATDVETMQVWTDAFAELVLQARASSAEWAALLERVYRFFSATLSAMLHTLAGSRVAETEHEVAELKRRAIGAEQALASSRAANRELLKVQPTSLLLSEAERNDSILAYIGGAPSEAARRAARAAVLATLSLEQLIELLVAEWSVERRLDAAVRLVREVAETGRLDAVAAIINDQPEAARAALVARTMRTLGALQWNTILPSFAKTLPRSEGGRWAIGLATTLEPHALATVVEALVKLPPLARVAPALLVPAAAELIRLVGPSALVELLVATMREWAPAQQRALLAEMVDDDVTGWAGALAAERAKLEASASAASALSVVDKLRLSQAAKPTAAQLRAAEARRAGRSRLPLLISLGPTDTNERREWTELIGALVRAAPAGARGAGLQADLESTPAEGMQAQLQAAFDIWGSERAAAHVVFLYSRLQAPDRIACLAALSARWTAAELRTAAAALGRGGDGGGRRHLTRAAAARARPPGTGDDADADADGGGATEPPGAAEMAETVVGAGALLAGPPRAQQLDGVAVLGATDAAEPAAARGGARPPAPQVWLRLTPEWARLCWRAELFATELPLRKLLRLISTLLEARVVAGESLPPSQHFSFPTFVFRFLLRLHGQRSHALGQLADLLYSVALHHGSHARVRVFAQLVGLLGEPACASALAFVHKCYTAIYPAHKLHDALCAAALVDGDVANTAQAVAFAAERGGGRAAQGLELDDDYDMLMDDSPLDEPSGAPRLRGFYAATDVRGVLAVANLPVSLDAQVHDWCRLRLVKGPFAEPLDRALQRYEREGCELSALHPPANARRYAAQVPSLATDELVEMLLRAHLALRREELRPLRELYALADASGDGLLTIETFSEKLVHAACALSGSRRAVAEDECEELYLEAVRESRMREPAAAEDAISADAWEAVAMRHALASGQADGFGLVLAGPLVESAVQLSYEPAFSDEERAAAAAASNASPSKRGTGAGPRKASALM